MDTMPDLPTFRPDDPFPDHSWFNRITGLVRFALNIRSEPGSGLTLSWTPDGLVLGLNSREGIIPVKPNAAIAAATRSTGRISPGSGIATKYDVDPEDQELVLGSEGTEERVYNYYRHAIPEDADPVWCVRFRGKLRAINWDCP